MKNVRVARRYAMALMMATQEQKSSDRTAEDLEVIQKLILASREFRVFIASPIVSVTKKIEIFRELLGHRVSQATLAFIELLTSKNRESLLPELIEQFNALRDEKLGIITVDVQSAIEFTSPQEKDLEGQLERYTKKKVRIRYALDKVIKGGLVVRIGDTVLDASIKRQLELLRERFVLGDALSN